jgi:hypothetical protein
MSAEEIATAFVQHFYQAFDNGVDALGGLFVSHYFVLFRLIIVVQACALAKSLVKSLTVGHRLPDKRRIWTSNF